MSEITFLQDLSFVWLSALVAGFIFRRIKQPMITGYILAGLFIGPYCLKLVTSETQISHLAELGVALLLFALGVELSLKQIFASNRKIVLIGVVQVFITTLVGLIASQYAGLASSVAAALLFGSICALSSTVVVTRVLSDRGDLSTFYGSILIAVLIVQDLALVPLISLISALNEGSQDLVQGLSIAFIKAVVLISIVAFGAIKVVPRFLGKAAKTGSNELFQLAVMSVCLITATLSSFLGMSVELGAFLAGIMVSESVYGYQALADIHPMKDLFSIVFFVSVGMMINPLFISEQWMLIFSFVVILFIVKTLICAFSASLVVSSKKTCLLIGLGLAQIGEFSFVLAMLGKSMNLIDSKSYDLYITASVITLLISPFVLSITPKLLLAKDEADKDVTAIESSRVELEDHLVLCGFGAVGHSVSHVMQQYSIPFVVVEFNALKIEELEKRGIRYIYGDAGNKLILEKAAVETAKTMVVAIRDHIKAATIIEAALKLNPHLKVVARAYSDEDAEFLKASGAHAVIQSEFETSIEFTKQTLIGLDMEKSRIKNVLSDLEERRYSVLSMADSSVLMPFPKDDSLTVWCTMNDESFAGKSIGQADFRNSTGCTIVAVKRMDETVTYPDPDFILQNGDELCIVGGTSQIDSLEDRFQLARFTPLASTWQDTGLCRFDGIERV